MILHLIPLETWRQLAPGQPYAPASLQTEGFIHCTAGDALLIEVANTVYRSQPGEFLVLEIDETKVQAEVRWEAPARPTAHSASGALAAASTALPPEAAAEFGLPQTTSTEPAQTAISFPHIYGPLNRDAIVGVRYAVRAADGTFTGIEPIANTPAGLNLKTPSQLAGELVDATGEFSDALARFKDHVEARMNEMDKQIKRRLGE